MNSRFSEAVKAVVGSVLIIAGVLVVLGQGGQGTQNTNQNDNRPGVRRGRNPDPGTPRGPVDRNANGNTNTTVLRIDGKEEIDLLSVFERQHIDGIVDVSLGTGLLLDEAYRRPQISDHALRMPSLVSVTPATPIEGISACTTAPRGPCSAPFRVPR